MQRNLNAAQQKKLVDQYPVSARINLIISELKIGFTKLSELTSIPTTLLWMAAKGKKRFPIHLEEAFNDFFLGFLKGHYFSNKDEEETSRTLFFKPISRGR